MVHIEGEIVIERPPEAVFDFVADERNEPRYNPRMLRVEQISAGPIGLGTRFRAEVASRAAARRDGHRVHRLRATAAAGLLDAHVGHGYPRDPDL